MARVYLGSEAVTNLLTSGLQKLHWSVARPLSAILGMNRDASIRFAYQDSIERIQEAPVDLDHKMMLTLGVAGRGEAATVFELMYRLPQTRILFSDMYNQARLNVDAQPGKYRNVMKLMETAMGAGDKIGPLEHYFRPTSARTAAHLLTAAAAVVFACEAASSATTLSSCIGQNAKSLWQGLIESGAVVKDGALDTASVGADQAKKIVSSLPVFNYPPLAE